MAISTEPHESVTSLAVQTSAGCGSVFKLAWTENRWEKTNLYEFTGKTDGGNPVGGVVLDKSGNLYGATNWGGFKNCTGRPAASFYQITP